MMYLIYLVVPIRVEITGWVLWRLVTTDQGLPFPSRTPPGAYHSRSVPKCEDVSGIEQERHSVRDSAIRSYVTRVPTDSNA